MIPTLYVAALLFLCAHIRFQKVPVLYILACACPLAVAWLGMDFSPSFTMMFLTANLALYGLAECLPLAALRNILFAAGALLSLPATYIYAVGDDFLSLCVRGAILAGALSAAAAALIHRKLGHRPRLPQLALAWLAFSAACFALACGLRSTMLLFYGAGLLLAALAPQFEGRARRALLCLGLLCASVFPAAPML